MRSEKLAGGIFLIGIGILFLLDNLGLLRWGVFSSLFQLWPLILIVIGINMIFKNKPYITVITWILFFALVIGCNYLYMEKYGYSIHHRMMNKEEAIHFQKPLETEEGQLNLTIGAARFKVNSTNDHLLRMNALTSHAERLNHDLTFRENQKYAIVEVYTKKQNVFLLGDRENDYEIQLNENITWDMNIEMGAVQGRIDLTDIIVRNFQMKAGAGDIEIRFGDRYEKLRGTVHAGASNLELVIPRNVGVRIKTSGIMSKTNFSNLGWNKEGDYYLSGNYYEADHTMDLEIFMGVGRLSVVHK